MVWPELGNIHKKGNVLDKLDTVTTNTNSEDEKKLLAECAETSSDILKNKQINNIIGKLESVTTNEMVKSSNIVPVNNDESPGQAINNDATQQTSNLYQDIEKTNSNFGGENKLKDSEIKNENQDKSTTIHTCGNCDSTFKFASRLKTHIESQHQGIRYYCDQCDHQATQLSNLKTHKQSVHEGKRYHCEVCDFSATQMIAVKKHYKSRHEGIRYYCKGCDFSATQMIGLKKHIQRKHT